MKWIKKFLSLFINKIIEGTEYQCGFNYVSEYRWLDYEEKGYRERTIFLCLPLPWKTEKPYYAPAWDCKLFGKRWFAIVIGLRYIHIIEGKRIFKPVFYWFWKPTKSQKILGTLAEKIEFQSYVTKLAASIR